MEFVIEKNMACYQKNSFKCSDAFIDKLRDKGLNMRADKNDDTVNGHIIIDHNKKKHIIRIIIYDHNEPASEKHLTTFKKPSKTFTLNELKKILE